MSKQSDDNPLNKDFGGFCFLYFFSSSFFSSFFFLLLFLTGQITEVFQVKGTVFSFRDHVNN